MKAWEASVFGRKMPEGQTCRLCDRPMPTSEKQGRRWAQSFNFFDYWICGECADNLREALED